jgi:NADH-quinone oxidoreductase subunit L
MGALRKHMPMTFATYAVGMMALSGVPLFFSGFWSKDAILHTAHNWPVSAGPFYLGLFGAFLTAFYMTRQVCYVFFGPSRSKHQPEASPGSHAHSGAPHESPPVMTIPLLVLAVCAIVVGFIGTPAWPWFEKYFAGKTPGFSAHRLFEAGVPGLMLLSALIVFAGIGLGVWLYWRKPIRSAQQLDAVELVNPVLFGALKQKLWVDELYEATVIRLNAWSAWFCDILDRWVWGGAVQVVSLLALGLSWLDHFIDEYLVNLGFDQGCGQVRRGAAVTSSLQDGQVQNYLRVIGVALTVLVLLLTWGYSR